MSAVKVQADDRADEGLAIGALIRRARRLEGLTLNEAAARSGGHFKPSTLAAYERGERRVTVVTIQRVADLYDVPVTRLLPSLLGNDLHGATLTDQIGHLPRRHRELLAALVDLMLRDTRR